MADLFVSKIVGTGNDFLFLDARTMPAVVSRAGLAKKLCDRHDGVGADGLVFVETGAKGADYRWDFYNSDGSQAEMCGNASRCMARWALVKERRHTIGFDTAAGRVRTQVFGSVVESRIDYLKAEIRDLDLELGGEKIHVSFVNTGVPHAVVRLPAIGTNLYSSEWIRTLRHHPEAGPQGTNVTLVANRGPREFDTITFERGVENFTLSCGTGVLAGAAVVLRDDPLMSAPVRLWTPGGVLEVSFGEHGSGAVLSGPAEYLFDVVLKEGFWK